MSCPYEQIYVQDISHPKAELKLPSISGSPIIDPHLSPDGSMLAYVRDYELHVMNLLSNESKQLTHGAQENGVVSLVVDLLSIYLSYLMHLSSMKNS